MKKQLKYFPFLISLLVLTFFLQPLRAQFIISTVAGGNSAGLGDGGQATSAGLNEPQAVVTDAQGNLYIADGGNNRVRKVTASTGIISTIAGTGVAGFGGDGGLATLAQLNGPVALAFDPAGNLYIGDYYNFRVRKISAATGIITTIAGDSMSFYNGDNILALNAELNAPEGLICDSAGNIYIGDAGQQRVRRIDAQTGIITTVAGGGVNHPGNGGLATDAQIDFPWGLAIGRGGTLYIADGGGNNIDKIDPVTHILTTIAGTDTFGFNGDGPALSSTLYGPYGLLLADDSTLLFADMHNNRVRSLSLNSNSISTVAGDGGTFYSGDGVSPTSTTIYLPTSIARDPAGNLYITDEGNNRIREIASFLPVINTGIKDMSFSSMSLYPNPTNASCILSSSGEIGKAYSIYDMSGMEVIHGTITSDRQKIDLSQISEGSYIIVIPGNNPVKLILIR